MSKPREIKTVGDIRAVIDGLPDETQVDARASSFVRECEMKVATYRGETFVDIEVHYEPDYD